MASPALPPRPQPHTPSISPSATAQGNATAQNSPRATPVRAAYQQASDASYYRATPQPQYYNNSLNFSPLHASYLPPTLRNSASPQTSYTYINNNYRGSVAPPSPYLNQAHPVAHYPFSAGYSSLPQRNVNVIGQSQATFANVFAQNQAAAQPKTSSKYRIFFNYECL